MMSATPGTGQGAARNPSTGWLRNIRGAGPCCLRGLVSQDILHDTLRRTSFEKMCCVPQTVKGDPVIEADLVLRKAACSPFTVIGVSGVWL